ncbi:hypothetical protein FPHOBKDP_00089 [Listeria phage LPJP1]|nr:hypothetical protein FPHOBKDP_00089 [Listeria phage LPJP1]
MMEKFTALLKRIFKRKDNDKYIDKEKYITKEEFEAHKKKTDAVLNAIKEQADETNKYTNEIIKEIKPIKKTTSDIENFMDKLFKEIERHMNMTFRINRSEKQNNAVNILYSNCININNGISILYNLYTHIN